MALQTGQVPPADGTQAVTEQTVVPLADFKVAFSRAAGLPIKDAAKLTPEGAAAAFVAMRGKHDNPRAPEKVALFTYLNTLAQNADDGRNAQAVEFTQKMSAEVDRLLEKGSGASSLANAMDLAPAAQPAVAAPATLTQPAAAAAPKASMLDVYIARQMPQLAPFLLADKQLSMFEMMYLMSPPPAGDARDRASRLAEVDPRSRTWAWPAVNASGGQAKPSWLKASGTQTSGIPNPAGRPVAPTLPAQVPAAAKGPASSTAATVAAPKADAARVGAATTLKGPVPLFTGTAKNALPVAATVVAKAAPAAPAAPAPPPLAPVKVAAPAAASSKRK